MANEYAITARKRLPRSPIEKDPNRPLIERALAMGIAMSQIGRRYGHTVTAISRYRDRMPLQLKAAIVGARVWRLFYRAGRPARLVEQLSRLLNRRGLC